MKKLYQVQFPRNLSLWRKAFGLSQYELGALTGNHHSNISDWERGQRPPGLRAVIDFCDLFGVSTDHILFFPSPCVCENPRCMLHETICAIRNQFEDAEFVAIVQLARRALQLATVMDTKERQENIQILMSFIESMERCSRSEFFHASPISVPDGLFFRRRTKRISLPAVCSK